MASNPKRVSKRSFPFDKSKRKIFIDSSILIAASISPTGSARDLIMKGIRGEVQIVISGLVIEETQRNLENKAPKALPALQMFLETLNPEVINPTKTQVLKTSKIVDTKDAPIVAAALDARANYLVSFDRKHLLQQEKNIKKKFKIKTVTPDKVK